MHYDFLKFQAAKVTESFPILKFPEVTFQSLSILLKLLTKMTL